MKNSKTIGFKAYPVSPGGIESGVYSLKANGFVVPVERIPRYTGAVVNYARLDYNGQEDLNFIITCDSEIGQDYSISPKSADIKGKVNKNTISNKLYFTINRPLYIVIRIKNKEDLFILIDSFEASHPAPTDEGVNTILMYDGVDITGAEDSSEAINRAISEISEREDLHTLYFPSGRYLSKQINMKSNVTVYLEGGVLIHATGHSEDYPDGGLISWKNIKNAKLIGRGQLDGNGRILRTAGCSVHNISMDGCKDCVIDGITELDSSFWGNHIERSDGIKFSNFKVINYRPIKGMNNSDGLNFDSSKNCSLDNGFLYTGDDNCVVKGTNSGPQYNVNQVSFRSIIGYSNSAACKIGTETTVETMENISFNNVDIVSCDRALVIDAFDNSHIKNVTFDDIRVEEIVEQGVGVDTSRLIEFTITDHSWRECEGRCTVSNILCKDIHAAVDNHKFPILIHGSTPKYSFRDVLLKNFNVSGRPITDITDSNFQVNEYVYNLRLSE
jgi:hypothetical protein